MHRYFVTGTDTDVGKTRAVAALAHALRVAGHATTVVKAVQTGVPPGAPGDAERAGRMAGVGYRELARFSKPSDPWSAAVAQGAPLLRARELAETIERIAGALVVEGSGGLMVPLNDEEDMGQIPLFAKLHAVIVVGLRLGCLNHALLTLERCRAIGVPVEGAVLVERWGEVGREYLDDVTRALQGKLKIFGILRFAVEELSSIESGSRLFDALVK